MTDKKIGPSPEDQNDSTAAAYPDLRTLREAKGLSLHDIYESTRISVANLDAIESRQYHLLPAPVYVRTFIKTYAQVVGADSQILLDAYEQYLASLNEALLRQRKETGETHQKTGEFSHNRVIWFLSAIMTVITVILIWSFHDRSTPEISSVQPPVTVQKAPDNKPMETSSPAASTPSKTSQDREGMMQAANIQAAPQSGEFSQAGTAIKPADRSTATGIQMQAQEPATDKKYHLTIEAREEVWLRIREDNNKSEQLTMKAGNRLERFASASFTIDVGNAGGIDISLQGKSLGSIGKRGEVVHLRLP